jgi:hypothetical protein
MQPQSPNGSNNRRQFIYQILTDLRVSISQILPNPSFAAGSYLLLNTACHVPGDYALLLALLIGWVTKPVKS